MFSMITNCFKRIKEWFWPIWQQAPAPPLENPQEETAILSEAAFSASDLSAHELSSSYHTSSDYSSSSDEEESEGELEIAAERRMPTFAQMRKGVLGNKADSQEKGKTLEVRIGGGAARGYAAPGAIRYLEEEGGLCLNQVKWFTGISIGALLSMGLALGMRGKELGDFTSKLDGGRLRDSSWRSVFGFLGNGLISIGQYCRKGGLISRFFGRLCRGLGAGFRYISSKVRRGGMHSWGFCEGKGLRALIEKELTDRLGIARPTFAELATHKVPLRVVTAQVCCSKHKLWSAELTPDASVVDVLLASMAVPGAFHPFQDETGHVHADGGIRSNIPPRDPSIPIDKSLIILFTNEEQRKLAVKGHSHKPIHTLLDFARQVFKFGYGLSIGDISDEEKHRALNIQVDSIKGHEFGATPKQRRAATREGVKSAKVFLEQLTKHTRQGYPEAARRSELDGIEEMAAQCHSKVYVDDAQGKQVHLYSSKRDRQRLHRNLKKKVSTKTIVGVTYDHPSQGYRTSIKLRPDRVNFKIN